MTTPPAVTLPDGMRVLTREQMRAVHEAVRDAARRHRVDGQTADEISFSALAAAGQFLPPPDPESDTCSALHLPHQANEVTADVLGVWQQCADEPGHHGHYHESDGGELGWNDGDLGAVPARPVDEEA
ncbi:MULTISPECIES: hypothetical protein [unclassified Streptomyces]|uniref:hypothetical protein n=1 Tax=unclassified Streptomyces TaxID=2593676 RepID=UPI0033CD911A